jgi:membrane protein DedA with SNARE-associated domain
VAQTAELPGFLAAVAPLLDRWGYLAVAGIVGVESFGVPAPGQTIMIAAAVYAGAGRLSITGVIAVAFLAAVIGDNIGYLIGRNGGRRAVTRFGRYVLLTPARFARAEQFFVRRGSRIVVAARFIDGLRQLNGVIAGITLMPWQRFTAFNAIGAVLWVGFWTTLAYTLGSHISVVGDMIHRYQWFAIGAAVLGVGGYLLLHLRRRRRRQAEPVS